MEVEIFFPSSLLPRGRKINRGFIVPSLFFRSTPPFALRIFFRQASQTKKGLLTTKQTLLPFLPIPPVSL